MHSRIEDGKLVLTLEVSVSFDRETGGYMVTENDGPDRTIRWGPVPGVLVDAFVAELSQELVAKAKGMRDQLLRQMAVPDFVTDLRPGALNRVPW